MNDGYRRVLVWFRKRGKGTALSHLELMREMEEALRRSGLPVRISEGAKQKVRMSFPTALPQGMASGAESMEIQVARHVTGREILDRLAPELPPGIEAFDVFPIYPGERLTVAEVGYEVRPREGVAFPRAEFEALAAQASIPAERRGRPIDLAAFLVRGEFREEGGRLWIRWTDRGTARPEDFLRALDRDPGDFVVEKTGLRLRTSFGEMIHRDGTQDTGE